MNEFATANDSPTRARQGLFVTAVAGTAGLVWADLYAIEPLSRMLAVGVLVANAAAFAWYADRRLRRGLPFCSVRGAVAAVAVAAVCVSVAVARWPFHLAAAAAVADLEAATADGTVPAVPFRVGIYRVVDVRDGGGSRWYVTDEGGGNASGFLTPLPPPQSRAKYWAVTDLGGGWGAFAED